MCLAKYNSNINAEIFNTFNYINHNAYISIYTTYATGATTLQCRSTINPVSARGTPSKEKKKSAHTFVHAPCLYI
jgi:hypothetical protein